MLCPLNISDYRKALIVIQLFIQLTLAALLSGAAVADTELVMVESQSCRWCAQWNAEIGTTYNKTPVGQIAPLRRIDIAKPIPADLIHIDLGRTTPIFILLAHGQEVGRVRGYPGKDLFWLLLDEQVTKLSAVHREPRPEARKRTSY